MCRVDSTAEAHLKAGRAERAPAPCPPLVAGRELDLEHLRIQRYCCCRENLEPTSQSGLDSGLVVSQGLKMRHVEVSQRVSFSASGTLFTERPPAHCPTPVPCREFHLEHLSRESTLLCVPYLLDSRPHSLQRNTRHMMCLLRTYTPTYSEIIFQAY